jgi:hypothetical protein
MVTLDCHDPRQLAEFWTRALDLTVVVDVEEFLMLAPAHADGVKLGLQWVPEPRTAKNRMHLDLGTPDRAGEVARLTAMGATVRGEGEAPGLTWTVLADPEGNEFCVGQYQR